MHSAIPVSNALHVYMLHYPQRGKGLVTATPFQCISSGASPQDFLVSAEAARQLLNQWPHCVYMCALAFVETCAACGEAAAPPLEDPPSSLVFVKDPPAPPLAS